MTALPRTFIISGPWRQAAWERESKHLTDIGMVPHEMLVGIDNDTCLVDHTASPFVTKEGKSLHPDGKTVYNVGHKTIVGCIRTLICLAALQYCPEDVFLTMDDDAEFVPDWRERYESAVAVLPDDWDILVLGHCCCKGKPTRHIGNNLYEVIYPSALHCVQIRKRCIPFMRLALQRIWAPSDIAMEYEVFPKIKVYTVLPRIANQRATPLPP